jgi:hypothetical protein
MIALKPHSQPKPRRLAKRQIVTIAAGFVCRDGIVIAADTKESYGDTHTYVDKTVQAHGDTTCGTITGSGNGYILDYIGGEIRSLIEAGDYTLEEFDVALRKLMETIYGSKALKSYPVDAPSDLATQLLVTYSPHGEIDPHLFLINSSLVTRVDRSAVVIGCGDLRQLADEIGSKEMHTLQARSAALYIVHEAKRHYSYVGGITRIITHLKNIVLEERTEDQPQREAMLDSVRRLTQRLTLGVVNPYDRLGFDDLLRSVTKEAREIHKTALKIDRKVNNLPKRSIPRKSKQAQ